MLCLVLGKIEGELYFRETLFCFPHIFLQTFQEPNIALKMELEKL